MHTVHERSYSVFFSFRGKRQKTEDTLEPPSRRWTTLRVLFRFFKIREGRLKTLEQCLQTEYVAISHVIRRTLSNDLYEGSRAMLIDKDKNPKWVPSKLEDVSDEMVTKCLSRSFNEDDDWQPLLLTSRPRKAEAMASKL